MDFKKKENKKDFFVPTFLQRKQEEVANEKVKKTTFFWQRKFIDSHLPSPKKKNALLFFFVTKFILMGLRKKILVWTRFQQKVFFSPQQHTYLSKKRKQHSLKNTKWVIWVRKAKPCNINWGENKSLFFLDLLVKRRINRCCSFFFYAKSLFSFLSFSVLSVVIPICRPRFGTNQQKKVGQSLLLFWFLRKKIVSVIHPAFGKLILEVK